MEQLREAAEAIRKATTSLCAQFDQHGAKKDLEEAVDSAGRILDALHTQYEQTHTMEHLNVVIQGADMILPIMPNDHPDRVVILSQLSTVLGQRFERMKRAGNIEDINRAIQLAQAAVDLTSRADMNRLLGLYNLGSLLDTRYMRTHNLKDLELRVEKIQEAVQIMPDRFLSAHRFQNQLAVSLGKLFERTYDLGVIERAISASNKAVKGTPDGDFTRAFHLNTQARLLGMRFEQTGVPEDLNRAIDILNGCLPRLQVGHADRAIGINYLGILTGVRFEQEGGIEDLETAIKCSREALDTASWLNRPGTLSNLANRLARRAQRNKDVRDLDCAIDYARQGLNVAPHDDPERVQWLGNLGSFFGMRCGLDTESSSPSANLNQAIDITKDAIKLTAPDDPGLGALTNTIANLLRRRSKQNGSVDDLNEAVNALEEGLKRLPACHPEIATLHHNLGETIHERYKRTKSGEDLERSIAAFEEGWSGENATTTLRIDSAVKAAELLVFKSNWEEATIWLERAVHLFHILSPRYLRNTDKQHMIRHFAGLSASTAAAALNAGKDASYALQYLELGRGIISGLLLDLRTDLSSLRQEHPDWADQIARLRDRLDAPAGPSALTAPAQSTSSPSWELKAQSRREADEQLKALLDKIRSQPRFKDFMLAPTAAQMMQTASPHPVVVLNVSPFRCDAFLVKADEITVQPLPDLTLGSINDNIKQMRANSDSLPSILEWLWDVIVHPVLKALGFHRQPSSDNEWPHIWWVPVGPLSYLPIHAAGYHEKSSGETTLDRVISSYSSSIKTLMSGRHQQSSRRTPTQALVISMPNTPGHTRLDFTETEVEMLEGVLPSLHLTLTKPERTYKPDVLSHLSKCDIFHFAGHGVSDPLEPSRSRLLLQDWSQDPLTVGDLRDQRLQDNAPFLAYLSACSTSANEELGLSDEAIHLVGACQLAGFRHVVGTLWTVSDMACVDVARRVYETIRDEDATDESVCRGLHFALRELRDAQSDNDDDEDDDNDDDDDQVERGETEAGQKRDDRGGVVAGLRSYSLLWVPYVHFGV
ncbi:CHAT domain-containing protein [Xylaria acuta]|nr:CHAT domain-containing protein [Xylaria acuta]